MPVTFLEAYGVASL